MAKRQTFRVEDFKAYINKQLTRTDEGMTTKKREGLCMTLEHVLHETGNYKGYNDLYWWETGSKLWEEAGKPETFPLKDKYIHGEVGNGNKYDGCRYARRYY